MAKKFLTGVDASNQRIINVGSPTTTTDAVNKTYVDSLLQGLSWKQPVRVATTANGALATAYANGQVVDGVTLATGDRILLKDQTTTTENGIYTVNATGAPTRATDADVSIELNNATAYVMSGTVNADKAYVQTVDSPTLGTTGLVFAQTGGGVTYTAGVGLTLTSNAFAVNADGTSVIADGTSVRINPAYVGLAKRYAINVPSGSTTATITHNLATTDVNVAVYDISVANTYVLVEVDVTVTGANTLTLGFAVAPTTGQYRVVVTA